MTPKNETLTIDVNELTNAINEELQTYSQEVKSNIKNSVVRYSKMLVDEIKKRTNYNIIETNSKTYNVIELEKIYESCFIGLRLTKHDGLPNTVLEMGLMGRKCLHNGNTPNSLNYESVDDIIKHIDAEYSKRHENSENVVDDVYDFLNIGEEWLKV